jgi:hypothetical protein
MALIESDPVVADQSRPWGPDPELIEDPRVLAQFVGLLAEQHHPVAGPSPAMCSCGEPYLACRVGLQIQPLLAAAGPPSSGGPSHWFG